MQIYLCSGTSDLLRGWLQVSHVFLFFLLLSFSAELAGLLSPAILLSHRRYQACIKMPRIEVKRLHGQWLLTCSTHRERPVVLYSWAMFQDGWVKLLFLDRSGREISIWYLPDNSDVETRRQLRVWLNLQ